MNYLFRIQVSWRRIVSTAVFQLATLNCEVTYCMYIVGIMVGQ